MNLTPWEQEEREAQPQEPEQEREPGQEPGQEREQQEQEQEPGQAREPVWQGWRSYGESWSVS